MGNVDAFWLGVLFTIGLNFLILALKNISWKIKTHKFKKKLSVGDSYNVDISNRQNPWDNFTITVEVLGLRNGFVRYSASSQDKSRIHVCSIDKFYEVLFEKWEECGCDTEITDKFNKR